MKVLVTYMSSSGNTERMAKAIFDAVPGPKDLKAMDEIKHTDGYDLMFVGFPVIGRGAPRRARKFLAGQARGKQVALFITHGMPGSMEMLKPMLERCRTAAQGAEVVGSFDCQGRLVGWMARLMRAYPNAEVRRWVRAGGESIGIGHPSAEELRKAREFAQGVMNRQGQPIVG